MRQEPPKEEGRQEPLDKNRRRRAQRKAIRVTGEIPATTSPAETPLLPLEALQKLLSEAVAANDDVENEFPGDNEK